MSEYPAWWTSATPGQRIEVLRQRLACLKANSDSMTREEWRLVFDLCEALGIIDELYAEGAFDEVIDDGL